MKNMNTRNYQITAFAAAAFALLTVGTALANTQYWSGANTWDTGLTAAWAANSGGPYNGVWTNGDDAVFEGTAGTVTIGGIAANNLAFNVTGYTLSGANTLTLGGAPSIITIPSGVSATNGNNTAAILAGSGGLTLAGGGTLTLNPSAVSTFTGGLTQNGGTLIEDFTYISGATPTDLINNSNTLTLGGGNLTIKAKSYGGNNATQTFNGLTLNSGGGQITGNRNYDTSLTVNFGAIAANTAGSSLLFTIPLFVGPTAFTTALPTNSTGIYGGRIVFNNASATAYDWATTPSTSQPYAITNYSGYTPMTAAAANDANNVSYSVQTSGTLTLAGAHTHNTLKLLSGAYNANLDLSTYSLTLAGGGLLFVEGGGYAQGNIVNGGNPGLMAGDSGGGIYDLVVQQYSAKVLYIGSIIGDNSGHSTSLTKAGPGQLTLKGANTFSGGLYVNAGTVALSGSGAINSCTKLAIAEGGAFDVSALSSTYNFPSGATLVASGACTNSGGAATIKGNGTVNLGTRPITLAHSFLSGGDTIHPCLYVSQGALTLGGNAITLNGAQVTAGTYRLIQVGNGSSGTLNYTACSVTGTAVASASYNYSLSASGGNLNLVVQIQNSQTATTTTLTRHTGTGSSTIYGAALSFDASVSPSAATGTVTLKNGGAAGTTIGSGTLSGGACTITANAGSLAAGTYTNIVAIYGGDTSYAGSTSSALAPAQTVAQLPVILSGAKTYDGNAGITNGVTGASLSISNKVGGDDVSLTSWDSASLAGANGPSEAITSIGSFSLGGAAAANYTLTGATGTVTINPKTVSLYVTKTYDGYATTTNATFRLAGLVNSNDANSLTVQGVGYFTNKDVFAASYGISNWGTLSLSGPLAADYTFQTNTAYTYSQSYNFVTVSHQVIQLGGTKPYDGLATIDGANLVISNEVDGDTLSLSGTATLSGAGPGTVNIWSIAGLTLNNNSAGDYVLPTYPFGTVTITAPATGAPGEAIAIAWSADIATITFTNGTPGVNYATEKAASVTGPWTAITTNTADANGSWTATDSEATDSAVFYRARNP